MRIKHIKIILPLLALTVGAMAAYFGIGPDKNGERVAKAAERSAYVYSQYQEADYDSAKQWMINHVRFLDQMSAESGQGPSNPFSIQAMIWCVRLAKLEERNNKPGAADYMNESVARCERLGRSDCSEQGLRGEADRLDQAKKP
jgi:hypothetical protein